MQMVQSICSSHLLGSYARQSCVRKALPIDDRLQPYIAAAEILHTRRREALGEDSGVMTSILLRERRTPILTVMAPVALMPVIGMLLLVLGHGMSRFEILLVLVICAAVVACATMALVAYKRRPRADVIHAAAAIRPFCGMAVWQAAIAWVAQSPAGRLRGLTRRGKLGFLIEVDVALASKADSLRVNLEKYDTYVFDCSSGTSVEEKVLKAHYYTAQGLSRGVKAAAPLAAGQLRTFLDTAGRDVMLDPAAAIKEPAEDEAIPAWRALELAMQWADNADGAGWIDEGCEDSVRLSSRKAEGASFPIFRGMFEAPGRPGDVACSESLPMAAEVFAFVVSSAGQKTILPHLARVEVLARFGKGAWLSQMLLKAGPLDSAREAIVLQVVRRQAGPGGEGTRFTFAMVPAPEELQQQYASSIRRVRDGQTYKKSNEILFAYDIRTLPGGGLRSCSIIHADPPTTSFVPKKLVRAVLRTRPVIAESFVEMARNLLLPQAVLVQVPFPEHSEEVQLAGRPRVVSSLLSNVLADA